MLRDVIIHMANDQPLLADLSAEPEPGDNCVVCTNLRTLNGKTPVFVERGDSTFIFPWGQIRFIEVRPPAQSAEDSEEGHPREDGTTVRPAVKTVRKPGSGKPERRPRAGDDEPGPSPLTRLAWVSGADVEPPDETRDNEDEDDPEELMRRVKEV